MKNIIFLLVLTSFISSAQTFKPGLTSNQFLSVSAVDTVKILGIMVEFQQDSDNSTVGNGKFNSIYVQDYGNTILDPLPHDAPYFEAHLLFAKNYFEKVSKGKQSIQYSVLPAIVTVSQTMRNYSPPINSSDFKPVGDLFQEAWSLAVSQNPGFDFSAYNMFVIFHAGVGRDVSLPGSLGNERDIPSIYLSDKTLKNLFGSNYQGVNTGNGNFFITNSAILPQTQNREVESFNTRFLYQITFNGLLVSSIGSFLGLPDLFDTRTGFSAIGRFGLMDGQSIFAYNGCFPPEPSPWEKIALGWINPVVYSGNEGRVTLTTYAVSQITDTTVLKLDINNDEYYLLENRKRDALKNGAIVTIWNRGSVYTKTFYKDTTGFYSFSVDSLEGVVIDVDEFDWAVPGNGIVVWHIDEKVIKENFESNSINTNKFRRGVDVVEADGIQDIGEEFYTIFGDRLIGEGTFEDFWFSSNPAELFKNKFDGDSRPASVSNSGAFSNVSLSNFSDTANTISFSVSLNSPVVKSLSKFKISGNLVLGSTIEPVTISESGSPAINNYIINNESLYEIDALGNAALITDNFSNRFTASTKFENKSYIAGVKGNVLTVYNSGGAVSNIISKTFQNPLSVSPVIHTPSGQSPQILAGDISGKIYIVNLFDLSILDSLSGIAGVPVNFIFSTGNYFGMVQNSTLDGGIGRFYYTDSRGITFNEAGEITDILVSATTNSYYTVLLTKGNEFLIYDGATLVRKFTTTFGNIHSFAIADLKSDGNNYIVFSTGKGVYAINMAGSLGDNFPYEISHQSQFNGYISTGAIESSGVISVLAYNESGSLYAVNGKTGKQISGFPISYPTGLSYPLLINQTSHGLVLTAVSKDNFFTQDLIEVTGNKPVFSGNSGNNENTRFVRAASGSSSTAEFLPKSRVYNYPNPVYDNVTYIRFFVSEDSEINIKIFDLSGDFVAELNGSGTGGFDNEISWNVSDIQSGVYIARFEAKSLRSAQNDNKTFKIAVVK